MWFVVVEVEHETSAPPSKNNPGPAPGNIQHNLSVSLQITHPAEKRLAKPVGLRPPLFPNSGVGSFTFHKNQISEVLWDQTYVFRPYLRSLTVVVINFYMTFYCFLHIF